MVLFVYILSVLKTSLLICTLVFLVFVLLDKVDKEYGYHLFLLLTMYSIVVSLFYLFIFVHKYFLCTCILFSIGL